MSKKTKKKYKKKRKMKHESKRIKYQKGGKNKLKKVNCSPKKKIRNFKLYLLYKN